MEFLELEIGANKMIKIKNLTCGYGKIMVIKNMSVNFEVGKINLIIGPNGCGKTTLLKSIYNLCDRSSGRIFLGSEDITYLKPYELIRLGVGYIFQRDMIFKRFSVLENLEISALKLHSKWELQEELRSIFKLFPLLERNKKKRASYLSGGQQKILAIAMSLIQKPKILILDEILAGLSVKATREVVEIISKLNKIQEITLIMVEQNIVPIKAVTDFVFVLEQGRVKVSGRSCEVFASKEIKEVYFGN